MGFATPNFFFFLPLPIQHLSFTAPYFCYISEPLLEMETDYVRSLLVLQNKHYLTPFKGDCRYYILIAIILIPAYPVYGAMILELVLKRCPTAPKFKSIEWSPLYCLSLSPPLLSGSVTQWVPKLGASTPPPPHQIQTHINMLNAAQA